MIDDPEVTIEPADNGYIVRHYARSTKKDEPGKTIRRLALTKAEALGHAGTALSGGKTEQKKHSRRSESMGKESGSLGAAPSGVVGEHSPRRTHSALTSAARGNSHRRRRRVGGRR